MSCSIITKRKYETWPSWYVVYEWEDILSKKLGMDLEFSDGRSLEYRIQRKWKRIVFKYFHRISFGKVDVQNMRLAFIMNANDYYLYVDRNVIPIFLDFPEKMISVIAEKTKNLPFFFVTALEICDLLKAHGSKNVIYMPISISDMYFSEVIPKKTIDVIQFGRKNPVLHEWMMEYVTEHPDVEYVYQSNNGSLTYISTTRGNLGKFDKRNEYVELLKSCRISLVSTPGMDKSRTDFGNVDFFTPRFFESAAFYCHMLGRYIENQEADFLNIYDICPNVKTKQEFFDNVDKLLKISNDVNVDKYKAFLHSNLTSKRADLIKGALQI